MPAPSTPGTSFYADKRKQNPPGRPRSPYRCATMGTLGKSLVGVLAHLRLIHASSERFFRWRGCPRGAAKGLFFLVAHPGAGGVLRGHSQQVGRSGFSCAACSSAPLKCAFRQGFLSHKNPCAGVGARAPTSQPQDGILNKGRGLGGVQRPTELGFQGIFPASSTKAL